jgi:hypothetical protein
VSVQGRASGLRPAILCSQELPQLGPLVAETAVGVVEDLRDRAPSRPPGEDGMLVDVSPPTALVATTVENSERVEVRT